MSTRFIICHLGADNNNGEQFAGFQPYFRDESSLVGNTCAKKLSNIICGARIKKAIEHALQ